MRLLFILLIIISINLYAEEQIVNKLKLKNTEKITLLVCLDSNDCYAISDLQRLTGDNDFLHSDIYLYKSTDQGATWSLYWETYNIPGKDSVYTLGKSFILDSNYFYYSFLERMIIDYTTDGGNTIKRLTFGELSLDEKYIIDEISMYDENIGIILFNYGILSTNDNWETFTTYLYKESEGSSKISEYLDSNNVLIQSGWLNNSFDIFNIPNQTRTKYSEPLESPPGEEKKRLYNIEMVTDSLFYATGGQKYGANEYGKDIIYRTTDRGRNWEIIYENLKAKTFSCTELAFINENHGIASGGWGKLMGTFDGGLTWNYYEVPTEVEYSVFSRVAFAGSYPLLSASNGGIYRIEEVSSVAEPTSNGISIVPNPAEEYIEISLCNKGLQPFANSSDIEIYDLLGEKIMSVETRHALSLQRIDVSHLPRGVYFVKIGDRVEKLVKM